MQKTAINLQPGDKITGDNFPENLYSGEVEVVTVVDRGVQIGFVGGGFIVRPEDHLVTLTEPDPRV